MQTDDRPASRPTQAMTPIATGEQPRGLARLKHVRAMLFDVYGTLVISRAGEGGLAADPGRPEALQPLLRRFGIVDPPARLNRRLREAIAAEHARLRAQGIDYPEIDIRAIWRNTLGWNDLSRLRKFAREYESIVNPVYPMPGLQDLLRSCRERELPLGIISNAQFFTPGILQNMLDRPLAAWGFDPQLVFFSYRFQRAKPSVRLFEMAARRLLDRGIRPAGGLFVGNDMRNDVLPARSVGFRTALFAGDRRSLRLRREDACCRDFKPDMVVTDLRQLIDRY